MQKKFYFMLLLASIQLYAEEGFTVHNDTAKTIYAVVYCVPGVTFLGSTVKVAGDVSQIAAGKSAQMARPARSNTCTRQLTFSDDKAKLQPMITTKEFNRLDSIGVGITSGGVLQSSFRIKESGSGLVAL